MKTKFYSAIVIILFIAICNESNSQTNIFPSTGAAGIGTTLPNPSSLFEVVSTSKGILIPRMTQTQRDAIAAPSTGLLIYQTNKTPGFYYYEGSKWTAVSPKGVNKSLSNLTAPTAVNVDLLPGTSNSLNLGSTSSQWKDFYLGGKVFMDGESFLDNSGIANTFIGTTGNMTNTGVYNTFTGSNAGFFNTTGGGNSFYGATAGKANTSGSDNSFFGAYTGTSNTSGFNNSFSGYQSGFSNTTGSLNTSYGCYSLFHNINGNFNTSSGFNSLYNNTSGSYNTAYGMYALDSNTTGYNNTGNGYNALSHNSIGNGNTATGAAALFFNTTGNSNTATGITALDFNTTGSNNTANGSYALYHNTTGYSNVAIGIGALLNNTEGFDLVAVGDSALYNQAFNPTGAYSNTAVGHATLFSNTTGYDNTAIGHAALYSNTTGDNNSANGDSALYSNTTGYFNNAFGMEALYLNTEGFANTAIGNFALHSNTTGIANNAIGGFTLNNNTTGQENTAIGDETLVDNTTGSQNTATGELALAVDSIGSANVADGAFAGYNVRDGNYNTFVGYNSNCGSGGHITNGMAFGYNATVTSNNHVVVGNSLITSIGGSVNWTVVSDGRVKKNIKQNVPGLEFINKLQPITYNLDLDAADKIIERPTIKRKDRQTIQPSQFDIDSRKAKQQIVYTGFIAQDVEKAAKSLNYDFSGVDKPDNANTLYGLRYGDFVVPLVKAVQELSAENDSLKNAYNEKFNEQQKEIDELKEMITSSQSAVNSQRSTISNQLPAAFLSQNIPNPFSNTTTIDYTLPQQYSSAKISITDKSGKVLKEAKLSGSGRGSITLDASTFSSGAYQYSFYVDSKLIDTKQMVLAK